MLQSRASPRRLGCRRDLTQYCEGTHAQKDYDGNYDDHADYRDEVSCRGSGVFYQVVTSYPTALLVMGDGDIPGVHIFDDRATASEGGGHDS